MQNNADCRETAKRLHRIKRTVIIMEIFFPEFTGTAPEKQHEEKIIGSDTNDRPYIEVIF